MIYAIPLSVTFYGDARTISKLLLSRLSQECPFEAGYGDIPAKATSRSREFPPRLVIGPATTPIRVSHRTLEN